jgi:hypothetical protein
MLPANFRIVSKPVHRREREDRRSTSEAFGGMEDDYEGENSMHHLFKDDAYARVRAGSKSSVSITVVMKGSSIHGERRQMGVA